MANNKDAIPANLRNELRRCVSVIILDYIYTKPPMKKLDMERLMYDCFHGNDDKQIGSHMRRLVLGEEPYDLLYDTVVSPVTNPSANTSTSNAEKKYLKADLLLSEKRYAAGEHINENVLSRTTFRHKAKVSGRNLLSTANATLRTVKKAIAVARSMVDDDGNVKESGKSSADVLTKVRRDLYVMLKGKSTIDECDTPEDDEAVEVETTAVTTEDAATEPPEGWFFAGYFAFVLFGPLVPPDQRLGVFVTNRESFSKNTTRTAGGTEGGGRAAMRARDAAEKAAEINAKRKREGKESLAQVTVAEKVAFANLQFRKKEQEKRKNDKRKERQLIALKFQMSAIEWRMERAERRDIPEEIKRLDKEYESTYKALKDLAADSPASVRSSNSVELVEQIFGVAGRKTNGNSPSTQSGRTNLFPKEITTHPPSGESSSGAPFSNASSPHSSTPPSSTRVGAAQQEVPQESQEAPVVRLDE